MNGLELIKKVNDQNRNVLFVIISGYAEFAYVQKALSYGVMSYCLKPFDKNEITSLLTKAREELDQTKSILEISGDMIMKYYRSQQYYDSSGWRGTWAMDGGGALMNQGIHGIDLLQYIMGPVKSVFAHARTLSRDIEVEDTASALLEFRNGALGIVQGTTSVYPGQPRRLEVNGDKGTITLEEDCISGWSVEGLKLPDDLVLMHSIMDSSSSPSDFGLEGHIRQITDMVDAVNMDGPPFVDCHEGRKSIEIIMAMYESSRTGKLIML